MAAMSLFRDIRRRARGMVPQILAGGLVFYFAYHAIQGERGINSWIDLREDMTAAQGRLAELEGQRLDLENKVRRLSRDNLDPDLLEERARVLLNYGRAGEVIVMLPAGTDGHAAGE